MEKQSISYIYEEPGDVNRDAVGVWVIGWVSVVGVCGEGWGLSKRDGLGLLAQGTPAKCLMTQTLTVVVFVHF